MLGEDKGASELASRRDKVFWRVELEPRLLGCSGVRKDAECSRGPAQNRVGLDDEPERRVSQDPSVRCSCSGTRSRVEVTHEPFECSSARVRCETNDYMTTTAASRSSSP